MITDRTIGILGGGQLARMTIAAAMRLGVPCHVLDKNSAAPAANYTQFFTAGDPRDAQTVLRFAAACSVVTIDSEHVSAEALAELERQGKLTAPQGHVLQTIQNKCRQKEFLQQNNFPTAKFQMFASLSDLAKAPLQFPVMQKKATAGYDGYGVMLLNDAAGIAHAFDGESLVEEKIPIAKEIAVIVASDFSGARVAYDPVEMVFDAKKNILKYQLCPADITAFEAGTARDLALSVAAKLNIVGLLAVEMFITTSGEILINEMAPRPHNSGHHTIEAAAVSQYENLVRILIGKPLGSTETTSASMMINLLGPEPGEEHQFRQWIERTLQIPNAHLHYYGKTDLRPFRKLGHITLTGARDELKLQYDSLLKGISA